MANGTYRLIVQDGVTYLYDQARAKILSITRTKFRSGIRHHNVSNQFMRLEDGQPSMAVGDGLIRKATIVGLVASCKGNAIWAFEVYRNNETTPLASLSLTNASFNRTTSLNIDVEQGDILHYKLNGVNVSSPRGIVELAWRL